MLKEMHTHVCVFCCLYNSNLRDDLYSKIQTCFPLYKVAVVGVIAAAGRVQFYLPTQYELRAAEVLPGLAVTREVSLLVQCARSGSSKTFDTT